MYKRLSAYLICGLTIFSSGLSQTSLQKTGVEASSGVALFGGCIYLSGNGNASAVPFANSCNKPMQFTIQWAGTQPPRNVTYRINNWGSRDVRRLDTTGTLITEEPAKSGWGAPAKVRIEDRDLGSGQHLLMLVNAELTYIFVYGHVKIYKNGKISQDCQPATVIKPNSRERACVYFAGETFVDVLQADKDPN